MIGAITTDKVHLATIGLAALSTIFFITASTGFSLNRTTIERVPWIVVYAGDCQLSFGLRKVVGYLALNNPVSTTYRADCISEWCERCDKNGKAAMGLVFTALIFSLLTIRTCFKLRKVCTPGRQIANVMYAFVSACTSLVGVGLFMVDCYSFMLSQSAHVFPRDSMDWGPAAKIVALGMLLMWFASFLQIVLAVRGNEYVACPDDDDKQLETSTVAESSL
jgi:hypothetical protein